MKKNFFLILFIISSTSFGQSFEWVHPIMGIDNQLPTGNRISTNSNGESFIIGTYKNQSIIGSDTLTSSNTQATYLAKYNSFGTELWAKKITGTTGVHGNAITIDKQNNVYVTGIFEGNATFESTTLTSTGTGAMFDIYVAKYNSNGILSWVKQFSGNSTVMTYSVKVDSLFNIYLTGNFIGTRIFGSDSLNVLIGGAMFLVKLDSTGNPLWAKNFGNGNIIDINPYDITLDNNLNIYAFGHWGNSFNGPLIQNIIFGNDTLVTQRPYAADLFLAKFDNSGNPIFARKMGGDSQNDRGFGINYDGANNIYLTGCFVGQSFFGNDTVSTNPPISGSFVAKYDLIGNCIWVTKPDTNISFQGFDIIVNNQNNIYVAGCAYKNSLMKFDSSGTNIWTMEIGHSASQGISISSDQFGAIYITGTFSDSMLTNVDTLVTTNLYDNYIAKIDTTFIFSINENSYKIDAFNLNIYPNPVSDFLAICIPTTNHVFF